MFWVGYLRAGGPITEVPITEVLQRDWTLVMATVEIAGAGG